MEMTELTIRILRADDPDPTPEYYAKVPVPRQVPQQTTLLTYGSRVRQSKRIRQARDIGKRKKVPATRNMTIKDLKIKARYSQSSLAHNI